jgi:galactokinase
MAAVAHQFMDKVFVGGPAPIGTFASRYDGFLATGETVEQEFKGMRDGMVFTNKRLMVINAQGLLGKKVEVTSFPWRSITAFSLENSGTIDLDAELKICGSGWGVCEVMMTKGTDVREVAQFINNRINL